MKALSVRNPWITLIARGSKTVELRSRPTRHRGPLLLVSSLRVDDALKTLGARMAVSLESGPTAPLGHAICVVDVVDCRPATRLDTARACCLPREGDFAWVLANPRAVEPFRVSGRLGFFEVADDRIVHPDCIPTIARAG